MSRRGMLIVRCGSSVILVGSLLILLGIRQHASLSRGKENVLPVAGDRPLPASPLSFPGVLDSQTRRLQARAGVVLHTPSGTITSAQDAFTPYPIASLTKLMSAMVALDHGLKLDMEMTLLPAEYTVGGNLRVVAGRETVRVRDLVYASVTGSANNAALALARATGLSREEFVREMNRKAIRLGLESLRFIDPSGLDPRNIGSAYDVAEMASVAFTRYPLILDAASRGEYAVLTTNTHREHVVRNPNRLFARASGEFLASKTGYLDEALYCLLLAAPSGDGFVVAVTLGNPSEAGSEQETLTLLKDATPAFLRGARKPRR